MGGGTVTDHSLRLINRNQLEMSGVVNVNTFDEKEIILETIMGFLVITGDHLHITLLNLEEGKVAVEGAVTSMDYQNQGSNVKARSRNILQRLLK